MIIEFKVANYRSINEEQTLSFVADRATRHPDNLIKRPGYRLLKAVGLFGANASGKSNFIKALGAMSAFVRDSATKMNDGDPIEAAEPYRLDPATREQPSHFEITFVTDSTTYTYGFAADNLRVSKEWLSAEQEKGSKEHFGFEREYNGVLKQQRLSFSNQLRPLAELFYDRTRDNALMLSTAAREHVTELLPAYRYIRDSIQTYDMPDAPELLIAHAARRCKSDEQVSKQVASLLRDADTGIENIEIDKTSFASILAVSPGVNSKQEQLMIAANRFDNPSYALPITTFHRDRNGHSIEFDFRNDESHGTNRLLAIAVLLLDTLKNGAFLAVDELDASMHPLLTRKLLEMFQSPEANPNGAQLLFTTHDPSLLDQVLFRRDQIWLAEKCNGASTFFSLADIEPPIRNTEAFLGNYLAGRYGGTPHLGPAFDMVETGSKE